ncbi:MAG: aminoglycoside phosphotransferase family protein [Myxococcales bacterium]|nr:aminoglycoside phosphotransferase family protein [Myxococcales bacterium]
MSVPSPVLDAFGFAAARVEAVSGGLINQTYCIKGDDGHSIAALQCLHPIFGAEVNTDIEAITDVLAAAGMVTPRLIRTRTGDACVNHGGDIWRSISWVEGRCFSKIPNAALARSAAELVGRFHLALDGLDYDFRFARSGVHDTDAHFTKLRAADDQSFPEASEACALREQIFAQAESLPALPSVPTLICHGDLKISNLLFDANGQGLCLIDLDTIGHQTMAYELGDALRSWANLGGEDLPNPRIDADIVKAVAVGYAAGAQGLGSTEEIASVITGLETICLELAARFCVDFYEDSYFGWDATRFENRRAHNAARAKSQLALCQSVASRRDELQSMWSRAF